jgi:FkbM family methyltransferase
MSKTASKVIFRKTESKKLNIQHACEVGVYLPETSNVLDYIYKGVRTTLVEPDPDTVEAIKTFFGEKYSIQIFPVAVYDYNGVLELTRYDASTFVSALESSPALVNEKKKLDGKEKITVDCKRFDSIDDGTIDLLSVDTEGCEWYILKTMKSRPYVISLETHGKRYVNSFIGQINQWMEQNGYVAWYKDLTDTVYVRKGSVEVSALEKINLCFMDMYLGYRKLKYKVKDVFKKK